MRIQSYSGAESSYSSPSSSYSVSTVLEKPCTFELRMLYYNMLLLHKIEKIKMAGTSHEISSAMDENHDEYQIRFECTHKNSYPHRSHVKQNTCQCTQSGHYETRLKCSKDWSRLGFVSPRPRLRLGFDLLRALSLVA